jgi:hypothetical protein
VLPPKFTRLAQLATLAGTLVLAACGTTTVDSNGFTPTDRTAAQSALSTLNGSNIPLLVLAISGDVQEAPAACRLHLVTHQPRTFEVYMFWIPWLAGEDYTWLNMSLSEDRSHDRFHFGSAHPVLPGGQLAANGRSIVPGTVDTNLLSKYGRQQLKKNHAVLVAHAGDVFAEPGSGCQVLRNGDLRLLPNATS